MALLFAVLVDVVISFSRPPYSAKEHRDLIATYALLLILDFLSHALALAVKGTASKTRLRQGLGASQEGQRSTVRSQGSLERAHAAHPQVSTASQSNELCFGREVRCRYTVIAFFVSSSLVAREGLAPSFILLSFSVAQELIKHTPESHPDKTNLRAALVAIQVRVERM